MFASTAYGRLQNGFSNRCGQRCSETQNNNNTCPADNKLTSFGRLSDLATSRFDSIRIVKRETLRSFWLIRFSFNFFFHHHLLLHWNDLHTQKNRSIVSSVFNAQMKVGPGVTNENWILVSSRRLLLIGNQEWSIAHPFQRDVACKRRCGTNIRLKSLAPVSFCIWAANADYRQY